MRTGRCHLEDVLSAAQKPGHSGPATPSIPPAPAASPAPDTSPAPGRRSVTRPARPATAGALRYDVEASLVVFLVSLPLSLGIAVASGAPVMAGLIAAVVGGVVGGLVGGVPLQVSGPAAGLIAITAEQIVHFGWAVTCVITMIAGILQILLGLSRIARTALAISPAVVHGMLAGIGVTIAAGQAHVLLGGKSKTKAIDSLLTLPGALTGLNPTAAAFGLAAVVVMLGWPRIPRLGKVVPAPLAAVVLCTLGSLPFVMPRVTLPGNPLSAVSPPLLTPADWQRLVGGFGGILVAAFTVAMIASVESLLSAVAVDRLHDGPRGNLDRELIGQGASNLVSGAFSGLSISAVIVRSSTNVAAGAKSRMSSVLNGIWVASFAVVLAPLLNVIPLSVLAGLLVVIGVRLINPGHVRTVARHRELIIYLLTLVAVIALSLLEGVVLGYAAALVITLSRAAKAPTHLEPPGGEGEPWRVVIEGTLTFLALPRFSRQLAAIPTGAPVRLELLVDYLDHAAYELLEDWSHGHQRGGGTVVVDEIGPALISQIEAGSAPVGRAGGRSRAPRWLASWSDWQRHHGAGAGPTDLLTGVEEFHRRTAPMLKERLGELSGGQAPSTLFITCSDSRVVPNVITSSGPGDLFTVRNVGGLIPGPEGGCDSTMAAIEVAVSTLQVRTIVVCGHTGCSAMKHLLHGIAPKDRSVAPGLSAWLRHGSSSLARFRAQGFAAGADVVDELAKVNVIQQLENLRALDVVREAEAQGRVRLVGMMFDIAAACALILDESTGRFDLPGGAERRLPSRRASRRALAAQSGGIRFDTAGIRSLVKGLRPAGPGDSGSVAAGHGAAGHGAAPHAPVFSESAGAVSAMPGVAERGAQPGGGPAPSWQGVLPLPRVQGTPSEGLPVVGRPGDGSSAGRWAPAGGAVADGITPPELQAPSSQEGPRPGAMLVYDFGYAAGPGYGASQGTGYGTGYGTESEEAGHGTGYAGGDGRPGRGDAGIGQVEGHLGQAARGWRERA